MNALPDPNILLYGALAFLRIGGIIFTLPIFGDGNTPVRVKALISLALTVGLTPVIKPFWAPNLTADILILARYVGAELLIGLVIGFLARLAYEGILAAAGVVSYQMGFGTGTLFMPDLGEQTDAFSALHRVLVTMLFLGLGLHHIFISGIADTFHLIPAGGASLSGPVAGVLFETFAGLMAVAVQLSAPVLVALLLTMAALGIAARAVPQLNVFVISFPLSFFVGLFIYIATMPFYPAWLNNHWQEAQQQIHNTIRALAG